MDDVVDKTELLKRLQVVRQKLHALPTSEQSRQETIALLHRYNQVKDATQAVIGVVADYKQCTVGAVHRDLDLPTT